MPAAFEIRITPLILGLVGEPELDESGTSTIELADTTLVTQFSDVDVSAGEINEPRTGRVVLSIHDPVVADLEPFAQAVWVGFKRPAETIAETVLYGQCNVITDYAAETVTLEIQDPTLRMQHHYIRRGDEALNVDRNRGRVGANRAGLVLVLAAARNTDEQQDREVPALALTCEDFGGPGVVDSTSEIEFERGQECWDMALQIARAVNGQDLDVAPWRAWAFPLRLYGGITMWDPPTDPDDPGVGELGRNRDPADPDDPQPGEIVLDFGMGRDNLESLVETPGLPTTHAHVLDAQGAYRETSADADSSAEVGIFVDWIATDYALQRSTPTTTVDTAPLLALAEAHIRAYGRPPKFFTCTLRPADAPGMYQWGHPFWAEAPAIIEAEGIGGDFYVGDYVRARATRGQRSFSTLARITGIRLKQDGSNGLPYAELTLIPAVGGTPGENDEIET